MHVDNIVNGTGTSVMARYPTVSDRSKHFALHPLTSTGLLCKAFDCAPITRTYVATRLHIPVVRYSFIQPRDLRPSGVSEFP